MTNQEISLLLYLETRAVDFAGRVASEKMNDDDRAIAKRWAEKGYIQFGRIIMEDVNREGALWVKLSPQAMLDAHAERAARAERMWAARNFTTTEEKRKGD